MKIYLAGRMSGRSIDYAIAWRQEAEKKIADAFGFSARALNPAVTLELLQEQGKGSMQLDADSGDHIKDILYDDSVIFNCDINMVDNCDYVIANLKGEDWNSIGTLFELGYAYAKGKKLIVIAQEGDYARKHPFIKKSSVIVQDIQDAIRYLELMHGFQAVARSEEKPILQG